MVRFLFFFFSSLFGEKKEREGKKSKHKNEKKKTHPRLRVRQGPGRQEHQRDLGRADRRGAVRARRRGRRRRRRRRRRSGRKKRLRLADSAGRPPSLQVRPVPAPEDPPGRVGAAVAPAGVLGGGPLPDVDARELFFFFVVFFFGVVEVVREFIERASEMSDRERQQHKNSQSCSLTSLSERCLASSSVEGTPSAVVASEASHIKVRTPREPSAKPRRVRATSAGKDCADVAAARADELLILRPLFDALPSPPPAAAAPLGAEEEEGPAGEKSLLCAAARRTGERGEDGIVDEESSTTKDEEEERGERKKSAASSSSSSSSSSAAAAAFTFFLRTDSKILFFFFAGRRREGGT